MAASGAQGEATADSFAPISYIYSHLHDSIRAELDTLAQAVLQLQHGAGLNVELAALQERYRFLEQVYKYHSSVEDEASHGWVVPPAPPACQYRHCCRHLDPCPGHQQ